MAKESTASLAKADRVGKEGEKLAEKLYNEVPETSFTRSISNPEAVMKRKRQQKLEKKLQQMCKEGGEEAGKLSQTTGAIVVSSCSCEVRRSVKGERGEEECESQRQNLFLKQC